MTKVEHRRLLRGETFFWRYKHYKSIKYFPFVAILEMDLH